MTSLHGTITLSFAFALLTFSRSATGDDDLDTRMQWWREARFGMFIHWGLYAIPAGEWKGASNHAEWIRHTAQIPSKEYDGFVGQFHPVRFDADAWARMAERAGMKYLVITSKHHDGFCLWDSKETDYDVMSTPLQRDILAELAAACARHGVRLCFYHSIMDWHHPDYLPRRPWEAEDRPAGNADMSRYVGHMKRQLKELVTSFHPGVLWFDGEWENTWTHEMGKDLYQYVRSLDSDIIINNRVDKGRQGMRGLTQEGDYYGDFGTPEQEIPAQGLPGVDWESCMTMNQHWGWNKHDTSWKSTQDLVRKLIDIASKGGNFLLNIGPKADGTFPAEAIERLEGIGKWMDVYGESIYGTVASPFSRLGWGRCTTKRHPNPNGGTTLYLHVFDWPTDGKLLVAGLRNQVTRVCLLAGGRPLAAQAVEDGVLVSVPAEPLDPIATVIAMEIAGEPKVEKLPPHQAADGTMTLLAALADIHDVGGGQAPQLESKYGAPNIGYWTDARDWVSWTFKITESGRFTVTAEIASQGAATFTLKLGSATLTPKAPDTGAYDRFQTIPLGEVAIDQPGVHTLEVRAARTGWSPMNLRFVRLEPKR